MNTLNLDAIKDDASRRLQLTSKIEELQSIVDELYPGHKVLIEKPSIPNNSGLQLSSSVPKANAFSSPSLDSFDSMNGIGKIAFILRDGPISSKAIHEILVERGVSISSATVMSTLSRKKNIFCKFPNGTWGLVEGAVIYHEKKIERR